MNTTKSEDLLSRISISDIKCDKSNCNDVAHRQSIDLVYREVIDSLTLASDHMAKLRSNSNYRPIPGRNDYVKEAHLEAGDAFSAMAN